MTASLLNGCWTIPIPGDTPEEFTKSKKTISSLLGSTTEEVANTVGQPAYIALKGSKTYYVYEWWSDEADILMVGYIPIPWIFTDEATEAHCILLEFGSDRRLKDYKVDTESTGAMTGPPANCAVVFGLKSSK